MNKEIRQDGLSPGKKEKKRGKEKREGKRKEGNQPAFIFSSKPPVLHKGKYLNIFSAFCPRRRRATMFLESRNSARDWKIVSIKEVRMCSQHTCF